MFIPKTLMKLNNMSPKIHCALLLSLSLLAFASAQKPADPQGFIHCLLTQSNDNTISKIIYTPKNASFLPVLDFLIQNLRFINPQTPKPIAVLQPVKESQIQTAISCSKTYNIRITVRGSGHDFEGSSYISNVPFFVLDLFNFQFVKVDSATKSAWVGAGASLGQTYWEIFTQNSSLAFSAGFWPSVGVGGHVTGGGYGPLTRQYGLSADNVLDARIIDAYGRILDRKSMGEDLFWAIRGGVASNFGVIVAYKLNLVEVPPIVSGFQVSRTIEQNAVQLVYKWQQIARKMPVEIDLTVQLMGIVSPVTGNRTTLAIFVTAYRGRADALLSIFGEHFPELGLTKEDVQEMAWIQAYPFLLSSPVLSLDDTRIFLNDRTFNKSAFKWKVDLAQDPIPPEGLKKIFSLLNLIPPNAAQLGWTVFAGGIMDTIPDSQIPFPYRGKLMIMRQIVFWNVTDSQAVVQSRIDWVRLLHKVTGQYVPNNPRAQYADYRDYDLGVNNPHGPVSILRAKQWGIPYFNGNFERLVRVKTMVDPENYFRFEQSFPVVKK